MGGAVCLCLYGVHRDKFILFLTFILNVSNIVAMKHKTGSGG